jgi:hypothetical protein
MLTIKTINAMSIKNITKEQFDAAYNKHLPSGWIKFAYKYFSKQTEKKDMKLNRVIWYVLGILFTIGFFGSAFGMSHFLIGLVTIPYAIILTTLVLYLISAIKLNNLRLNKIAKELGVSKEEYDELAMKYA